MSTINNSSNSALKIVNNKTIEANKNDENIRKQEYNSLKSSQPFLIFISFIFKNLFFSWTNFVFAIVLPIIVFVLAVYLYPFYDTFPMFVTFPSIIFGVIIFTRAIFRFNNQYLINKTFTSYITISFIYLIINFLYSCLMFTLFYLLAFHFWDNGVGVDDVSGFVSPSLNDFMSGFNSHLSSTQVISTTGFNLTGMLFVFFQLSITSIFIGLFIGLIFYRRISLWIFLVIFCVFIFSFSLIDLPNIYATLPNEAKYITLINPFNSSFNLSYNAFYGYDLFNFDISPIFFVRTSIQQSIGLVYPINFIRGMNLYNLIGSFSFALFSLIVSLLILHFNRGPKNNINTANNLFITINELKRTSSFKCLFLGALKDFDISGLNNPFKNYVFNVENKKWNKFAADILMNRVWFFKKGTSVFNKENPCNDIQKIFFNDAVFSGLKLKHILNYYKAIDYSRYSNNIVRFDFNRLLNIKIEKLDYDSLFYLYAFSMMFNNKKIFIIDNHSLSKVSKKAVDSVEKLNLNYWIINDIKEIY